ncbi:hypothetical protein PBAL39_13135 [Pedobacter sp. BAL39]|uniref:DUF4843 domain-containing protein n=1 Tax=Pedobacter sp. BAL39 TaxID=391596 RepID=UPI0001559565|nr:DUF4843 domain-containing protein [Pedobacter sp. BAL39]EDM35415.1 hypothetical protein PBAL39_13135 [Pedobacter sp. BAL39]
MKLHHFIICALLAFASCKKAEEQRFDHAAGVYFDIYNGDKDSLVSTFAYEPTRARDTVMIPVRISGVRVDRDRTFNIRIEQDSSTAVPELHYQTLQNSYTIPANRGGMSIPVIIFNKDKAMEERAVSLIIKLTASEDFGIENPHLIRAKVVFSAKLEKPGWWDQWLTNYSRTKHELFILTTGQITLSTGTQGGLEAPKNLYFTGLLSSMLNNPFNWVNKNTAKGYILEEVVTGNTDNYYFYNTANPAKKTLLRKNPQSGRYYFIDENGKEVV